LAQRTELELRRQLLAGQRAPGPVRHAFAIDGRDEHVPVQADQLVPRPPSEALVRAIDAGDDSLEREGQDGIIRVVEEAAIPGLVLPNGLLGPSTLRDVTKHAEMLDRSALGVSDEVRPA